MMNIGLAMYTVHKHAEEDLPGTLCRVAGMGYRSIEFYGDMVWEAKEVRSAITQAGLSFAGWHVEWRDLQQEHLERTTQYLLEAGCPIAVIPCLGGKWNIGHTPEMESRDIWLSYFDRIEQIREYLAHRQIRLGYHNHEHEFQLSYDGKSLFEFIFDSLSPEMIIEFDSGNCIEGGDDPVRILDKYWDRDMILHMKPYSSRKGFDVVLGDENDENDWMSILDPNRKRYLWMLVESENTVLDEYENASRCLESVKHFTA